MKLAPQCLLLPVGDALESKSQGAKSQGALSKETVSYVSEIFLQASFQLLRQQMSKRGGTCGIYANKLVLRFP